MDKIVIYEDSGVDIYLKGDLHKLSSNYFVVGRKKETLLRKALYDFIINNQDKFTINTAAIYVRENGLGTTYQKVSQIFNELVADNIIKLKKMRHGYQLIASPQELKDRLDPVTIDYIGGWLRSNCDIFRILTNISNWVTYTFDTTKKLF